MPVWPKIVYTFSASLRTAATRRKLREHHRSPAQQEHAFGALTRELAGTAFWKEAGIEAGMDYTRFQTRVPLHTYEQIAPAVERMKTGESDVLWPGHCTLFGLTSGTSNGSPRCLPMTDALLAHFRQAGFDALLYYTARAGHVGAFRGRHLFYGATAKLTPLDGAAPVAASAGEVSGIAALNLPKWAGEHLYEPGLSVAQIAAWDAQADAIATHTRSRDITLIAGVPNGVVQLYPSLYQKCSAETRPITHLQDQWPNLECYVHGGALIAPYAAELRQALGPDVAFHDIYVASEAFVAAQDAESGAQGLRLIADMGVFFEFVAMSDFDDLRIDQLGPKAVPIAGVRTGIDYVILVTTPGGLARYVLGDVVRFTSVAPPRLVYIGGTQLRLNAFDENVTEKDLTDVLVALCQRRDWTLVNFHVAPIFTSNTLTGQQHGRHEWWIELKPGTTATPIGPQMAEELDADMQRASALYARKRGAGMLQVPVVRLVMPGVFEHWLRFHNKWGGQHKMPRCRSDRLVADEFAQITNFARD
jgi:hypothetical protein